MRVLRGLLGLFGVGVLTLAAGTAGAASISLLPSDVLRTTDDLSEVSYSVFLDMEGETDGVATVDLLITLDDETFYDVGSLYGVANSASSPFAALDVHPILGGGGGISVSFSATSTPLLPVPTPTGAESFYLGDIFLTPLGQVGTLSLLLDSAIVQTITPGLTWIQYVVTNPTPLLGTLTFVPPGTLPEPTSATLVALGMLGLAGLRARSGRR